MLTSRTCNATDLAVNVDRSVVTSLWSSTTTHSSWDFHRLGWAITAGCAIVTVLISLISTTSHALHYQNRNQQRQVIRILLMPAIYAVVAVWLYAADESLGEYLAVIEAVYEAITLSAFMLLLTSAVAESTTGEIGRIMSGFWGRDGAVDGVAGKDGTVVRVVDKTAMSSTTSFEQGAAMNDEWYDASARFSSNVDNKLHESFTQRVKTRDGTRARTKRMNAQLAEVMRGKEKRRMPFPFNFWRFRASKPYWLHAVKWSVLQYVIIRPAISITAIICERLDVLCPSTYSIYFSELYLEVVDFISISIALYGLLVLYLLCRDELRGRRPVAKFMAIKLIIFLIYYQSFMFSILKSYNVIKGLGDWTATDMCNALSALCTAVEMVVFALFAAWAYNVGEYTDRNLQPIQRPNTFKTYLQAIWDSAYLGDFAVEIWNSWVFFWAYIRGKPGTRAKSSFDHVFVPEPEDDDQFAPRPPVDAVFAPYGDAGRYAQLPENHQTTTDVKYHYQKATPNQRPAWQAGTPDLHQMNSATLPAARQPPLESEADLAASGGYELESSSSIYRPSLDLVVDDDNDADARVRERPHPGSEASKRYAGRTL